ncbi:MAG: polysaccharide pyruvyl transferase family protein, partial [Alistipes sp.]|nr:polysaccharide pyruvyl transferase family protein [Alistipes sp.]
MNYTENFKNIVKMIWDILHLNRIALNVWSAEQHKNWGDDLNIHLLRLITGKYIYVANRSLLHRIFYVKNYSCIGSILGTFEDEKTEIWGAGFISENAMLRQKPFKIHSVRGKLTRAKLLEQGVDCPENYGDPALLVSKFYKAKPIGKYKIGIIPHYVDLSNEVIKRIMSENDVLLIDVAHYDKWTDVCDMVVSCDYIVSSSLHGLILSDSYCIPN